MKKLKSVLSIFCAVALLTALAPPPVEAEPGVIAIAKYRKVKETTCRDQTTGAVTGYSNDCVRGDGSCIDRTCGVGEAEV